MKNQTRIAGIFNVSYKIRHQNSKSHLWIPSQSLEFLINLASVNLALSKYMWFYKLCLRNHFYVFLRVFPKQWKSWAPRNAKFGRGFSLRPFSSLCFSTPSTPGRTSLSWSDTTGSGLLMLLETEPQAQKAVVAAIWTRSHNKTTPPNWQGISVKNYITQATIRYLLT